VSFGALNARLLTPPLTAKGATARPLVDLDVIALLKKKLDAFLADASGLHGERPPERHLNAHLNAT